MLLNDRWTFDLWYYWYWPFGSAHTETKAVRQQIGQQIQSYCGSTGQFRVISLFPLPSLQGSPVKHQCKWFLMAPLDFKMGDLLSISSQCSDNTLTEKRGKLLFYMRAADVKEGALWKSTERAGESSLSLCGDGMLKSTIAAGSSVISVNSGGKH